jgi:TetR/AcrR family transcriptional regulator, tetracycline repressor protein
MLSRERVIDIATEIVAERGMARLSMRVLADRCGVGTMTLYSYVRTKDELVGAIGNRILAELALPDDAAPWDEQVRLVFSGLRRVLLTHPELAQIFGRQHINGASAYRAAEVVMSALEVAGLSTTDAVSAFSALSGFVIGFVLQEADKSTRVPQRDERLAAIAALDGRDFPAIRAAGADFLDRTSEAHFDTGLALLIDGIRRTQ